MNLPPEAVNYLLTTVIALQGWMIKEIIAMKVNISRLTERVDNVKESANHQNVVPMRLRK